MAMKNFWISWFCPPELIGKFELRWPWWVTGYRDDAEIICAAVRAESEEEAKRIILEAHDEPLPTDLEWRFVTEAYDDWSPFNDRFPREDWMQW